MCFLQPVGLAEIIKIYGSRMLEDKKIRPNRGLIATIATPIKTSNPMHETRCPLPSGVTRAWTLRAARRHFPAKFTRGSCQTSQKISRLSTTQPLVQCLQLEPLWPEVDLGEHSTAAQLVAVRIMVNRHLDSALSSSWPLTTVVQVNLEAHRF